MIDFNRTTCLKWKLRWINGSGLSYFACFLVMESDFLTRIEGNFVKSKFFEVKKFSHSIK